MNTRPLLHADSLTLHALLMRAPAHNLFQLAALVEFGLPARPDPHAPLWAVGAVREDEIVGVVGAVRGTGGVYYASGDDETLHALAGVARDRARSGPFSLISGHGSQIAPLLPLLEDVRVGPPDVCDFCTLQPGDLRATEPVGGFSVPRAATEEDMERLIDFYENGFYSLARLPSRSAWRHRLLEQILFRTLFIVEDRQGKVLSAALSSAESEGGAMLGGVATLPEYTGRGLSTWCVGALCRHLFQEGMPQVALFYLKGNARAGRVYEKLGFKEDGEWLLASLGVFS